MDAYLFHCTCKVNADSIEKHGIDARKRYPERRDTANYFVDQQSVAWAIAHTSSRHDVTVSQLCVYRVATYNRPFTKFFGKGLYVIKSPVLLFNQEKLYTTADTVLTYIRNDYNLANFGWDEFPF